MICVRGDSVTVARIDGGEGSPWKWAAVTSDGHTVRGTSENLKGAYACVVEVLNNVWSDLRKDILD